MNDDGNTIDSRTVYRMEQEIERLQGEVATATDAKLRAIDLCKEFDDDCANYQNQIQSLTKERDEARDIVDFNGDTWGEAEFKLWDKIKKLEAENAELKGELIGKVVSNSFEHHPKCKDAIDRSNEKIKSLTQKLADAEKRVEELEKENKEFLRIIRANQW